MADKVGTRKSSLYPMESIEEMTKTLTSDVQQFTGSGPYGIPPNRPLDIQHGTHQDFGINRQRPSTLPSSVGAKPPSEHSSLGRTSSYPIQPSCPDFNDHSIERSQHISPPTQYPSPAATSFQQPPDRDSGYGTEHFAGQYQYISNAAFSSAYPSSSHAQLGYSINAPLQFNNPALSKTLASPIGHYHQSSSNVLQISPDPFSRPQNAAFDSPHLPNLGTSPYSPSGGSLSPYAPSNLGMNNDSPLNSQLRPNVDTSSWSPPTVGTIHSHHSQSHTHLGSHTPLNTSPYWHASPNPNPGLSPSSPQDFGMSSGPPPGIGFSAFFPPNVGMSPYVSPNSGSMPHPSLDVIPTQHDRLTNISPSAPISSDSKTPLSSIDKNAAYFSGLETVSYAECSMPGNHQQHNVFVPEHDYLSLDFFDPSGVNNAFNASSNYTQSPAYDSHHLSQENMGGFHALTVPEGELYEGLEMRMSADPESESFLSMVADLKKTYVSTDESTNPGFLFNQIKEHHLASQPIKVIVHSKYLTDPFLCSCSSNDTVDHVIRPALQHVSSSVGKSHPLDFILKVYNQTEYLSINLPLAKFDYIHTCLKLGTDIKLELLLRDEISKPFLRKLADDNRALHFPKDDTSLNVGAMSLQDLSTILYTFYQKADFLLNNNLQFIDGEEEIKALEKSVKEICRKLANVETLQITEALTELKKNSTNLKSSNLRPDYGVPLDATGPTGSLQEGFKRSVRDLVKAIKSLVCMYCRAFGTDYSLASANGISQDYQDIIEIEEEIAVKVSSVHCFPSDWRTSCTKYRLACSLYHGRKLLADAATSFKPATSNFYRGIVWNEILHFKNLSLGKLPYETRMCFLLSGQQMIEEEGKGTSVPRNVSLCVGAIQLFSEKGFLLQGGQLVSLAVEDNIDLSTTSCKALQSDSIFLQVDLKDFEKNIFFSEPSTHGIEVKCFSSLSSLTQSRIKTIMEKNSSSFSQTDYQCLWDHRHYLTDQQFLYPSILCAAISWDWTNVPEICGLLKCWNDMHPFLALELLTQDFPDVRVRQFAIEKLGQMSADALLGFLPQLIQALKFESHHNSPLAKLLLEQSCKSPRFAHQFFWLLRGIASQEVSYQRRYKMLFVALANVSGEALCRELKKQEDLVRLMTTVTDKVKSAQDKDITMKEELQAILEMFHGSGNLFLPHNLSMEVAGLDFESCSYFSSNAVPLKLVFLNSSPGADSHYLIYKIGDDLRQDMLTMQIIDIMDSLWLKDGLDLKMIKFTCLTTGPEKGIIDLVRKSETLHKIQSRFGMMGSFMDEPIVAWLQQHNPTAVEYRKAVENFTLSCAGYCVATYILGVCDRHNDNIMIKETGHMFHIDFGKFLGDAQMFGNFKRDRVPFVFTSDMAYVITDGGKHNERFQDFVDLCCQAFNILRQHADLLRSLFLLMSKSGIHMVTEQAAFYVQNTLYLGLTNKEATAKFTQMIGDSLQSFFTKVNFMVHNLAHMDNTDARDDLLLTFVPHVYSKETDGVIKSVELFGHEKRYIPEKHYIFIFMVRRENQAQHSFVFRHFSEILEWRDKLCLKFPSRTWPDYSTRLVIGRSNIRTVADSRKMEISNFLKYLWNCEKEIIETDLIYTFFHSLIRDEEEAEKSQTQSAQWADASNSKQVGSSGTSPSTGVQGEIKLSIQYQKGVLQIMVMHVRDLPEEHALPSAYVKTRLLPDPSNVRKLKTKIVRRTCHPTYNELLQYKMPLKEINRRILLVSVWNEEMLKHRCLGAVYIRPCTLDLNLDHTAWYKLGPMQLGD